MTVFGHLDELRYRLVWIIGGIGLGAVGGWMLFDPVIALLIRPAQPYLRGLAGGDLVFIGPLDAFRLRLKVAIYLGVLFAFPLVLFHVWRFIAPGLHKREKRFAVPFVIVGTILFAGGVWFAFVTLPEALKFLIGTPITGQHFKPLLTGRNYVDFILLYLLCFGLAFEFPIVLLFLMLAGVITSKQLRKVRRHAIVGISIVVAIGTPSVDVFTMVVLTAVLYLMYESCIWIGRALKR